MRVKELIKQLLDCDLDDDVYIRIENYENDIDCAEFYSIDGLEHSINEYKGNPTIATLKTK